MRSTGPWHTRQIANSPPIDRYWLLAVTFVCAATGATTSAGQITIQSFSLTPTELKLGASFDVCVKVTAEGVPRVGYVLRTSKPISKQNVPPGLSHYNATRRLAYVHEKGQVHLSDNGPHDLDPADRTFRIRLSTANWRPGRYDLSIFAHNRPGPGAHVVDERRFAVVVQADRVKLHDLGRPERTRFRRCEITPAIINASERTVLHIDSTTEELDGVEIRQPFYVAREHVPPGFTYDARGRIGRMIEAGANLVRDNGPNDSDSARGRMAIPLNTTKWRAGLYHLEITLRSGEVADPDVRNLAIKVRSPHDRLDVTVSPSWRMCSGTHAERMSRLSDGTLLHTDLFSTDNGLTWRPRETGTIGAGSTQLRDGLVMGMGYKTLPIDGRAGWYRGQRFESTDLGRTVRGPLAAEFHVPQAKPARGHAFHRGPLYMRSIVERPDGSLVALMAGWFKGDETPCPHSPKRPYSRTYVCESSDAGKTWRYVTTIGYAHLGSEGYNEGSMKALPNGHLLTVLRTGSMRDRGCQDNPVMQSVSTDWGRTWSRPKRTGAAGAFPELLVLSDGTLAASYGRPGACIMFSTDRGRTWADHTVVDTTPYSGYTTLCEMAPGEILMAFGTRGYLDPATGKRSDDVRLATVRYRPKAKPTTASSGQRPVAPTQTDGLSALRAAGVTVADLGHGFFECRMRSAALDRDEVFALHLPDGYRPDRAERYPLIVWLHGSGRNHRTLLDIPKTRWTLRSSPCVILMPNGGGSWWIDSPTRPESRYQSHLTELIDLVGRHLNVSADPGRRAIGGWSMGGFGSANFVIAHPDQFGVWAGIVALLDFPNPAYPAEQNHAVPAVLGPAASWARFNPMNGAAAFRDKRVLQVTGSTAFDRKMNEAFAAKLESLKIPHTLEQLDGGHTIDVVTQALPKAMAFCHRHIIR